LAARKGRGGNREGRMSLGEHLLELRKRLFFAAIAIALGTIGGWFLSDWILDALQAPIESLSNANGTNAQLNYPTITAAFDIKFQIAFYSGLIMSSPIWLYQIFAFLVPGLTSKEKKYIFGFFFTAVPLFLLGCFAGWFVLPHIVTLLSGFATSDSTSLYTAKEYLDFVMKLVFAIGIAFVLPVFVVLLNFIGVVSGKAIIKAWRIAILAITLFTAIATPSADIVSMFLLAIPMVLLYLAAAGVAILHDRRLDAQKAALEQELAA
jgi:sec-independent protein translocase protein TatC